MGRFFWLILKIIFYIPFRLTYWTRVKNRRELRKHHGRGVVIVCNHKSYADGPVMWLLFHRQYHFPVKEGVVKKGFWRWFFKGLNLFPVKRGNDLALMRHFLGKLEKKHGVFFFPEGRRIANPEDSLALRNGAAMIAIKGGVPIVPMVMKRAPRMFRFNTIKIGQTISTEEYQGKKLDKADLNALSAKIQATMAEMLDGWEHIPKPKWWEKKESESVRGIVIHDGKLLLLKRVKQGQEYYVLPGGHLDEGESTRDAVTREILEETSVQSEVQRLLYKAMVPARNSVKSKKILQSYYLCKYKDGEPAPTDAPEYTDQRVEINGTYEPMFIDIAELETLAIKPAVVKKQLLKDIERYGIGLTRNAKYVK